VTTAARDSVLPPAPLRAAPAHTLRFMFRPEPLMESCHRRQGPIFSLRVLGLGQVVIVGDRELLEAVFTAGPSQFHPGTTTRFLGPLMGERSVLVVDEPDHMRKRRLLLPLFRADRLGAYEEIILDETRREMEGWPEGRALALRKPMQRITRRVIMRIVFGIRDEVRFAELDRLLYRMVKACLGPGGAFLPFIQRWPGAVFPPRFRYDRARAELDEFLLAELRARARLDDGDRGDDILSELVGLSGEPGAPLTDRDVVDHLVMLLLAGHETTATGLAWAFEVLARHPDVADRVAAEAAAGDHDYTDAVVKEALRLRTVAPWALDRELAAPMRIGDYHLPAGTVVIPCMWLVHHDERLYPDAWSFRPERFLDGRRAKYSWVPFGGGAKHCIGASLATLQMRLVVSTVLGAARLRPVRPEPEGTRRRFFVVVPSRGTRVVLDWRREERTSAVPAP
jgi:cytochrome P450